MTRSKAKDFVVTNGAASVVDYFHLPPNRVIELGTQIEI